MDISTIVKKMWDEPGKELLVVYTTSNDKIYKHKTFDSLLSFTHSDINEFHWNPITIFTFILSEDGVIGGGKERDSKINVERINLNKYQKIYCKKGKIEIGIKFPKIINPDSIINYKYDDIIIKRPAQLRRMLRDYFKIRNIEVNMVKLEQELIVLDINSIEYSYLDYDEIFFNHSEYYENTYINQLPIEIRNIISNHINNDIYLTKNDLDSIHAKSFNGLLGTMSGKIIKEVKEGNNSSLLDIFNNIGLDILPDARNAMQNNSMKDIIEMVFEGGMIYDLISDVKDKVTDLNI